MHLVFRPVLTETVGYKDLPVPLQVSARTVITANTFSWAPGTLLNRLRCVSALIVAPILWDWQTHSICKKAEAQKQRGSLCARSQS